MRLSEDLLQFSAPQSYILHALMDIFWIRKAAQVNPPLCDGIECVSSVTACFTVCWFVLYVLSVDEL
jgi:hypothetical protein